MRSASVNCLQLAPGGPRTSVRAERNQPAARIGIFPVPLSSLFVLCSVTLSVLLSLINRLLFTLLVSLCRFFPSLVICPSISGWHHPHALLPVWSGARWAGGLESWPLDGPVPPMLARPPVCVCAHTYKIVKTYCFQIIAIGHLL